MISYARILSLCLLALMASGAEAQLFRYHTQDRHAVLEQTEPAMFLLDSLPQQVDEYPRYAAGVDALYALIYKYVNYPEQAFQKRLGAKVEARFLIDAKGKTKVMEIAHEPSEMFRVRVDMAIRNMGKWIPAYVDGKPVDMQARITVTYEVQQGDVEEVHTFGDMESLKQQLRSAELASHRPVIKFYLPFSYNPYWKTGIESLQQLVDAELPYPEKALSKGERGSIKAKFMLDKEGGITELSVQAESKCPNLEKAVRNFVKKHPGWHLGADYGIEGPGYCYLDFLFDSETRKVSVKVL